jgi:enoyl-CoA hydratase/carnithine racemase
MFGGKIYIAKVHGYALGGGLELALACDITITEKQARLALPEITLGIHPGWTGTQTLPKIVGWKKALELILTGKTLSGEEAEKIGLINMAVETEKLEETVMGIAKTIIGNAPKALANAKRLIREAAWRNLEEGLEMERESFKKLMETRDAREGLKAFIEKRKPIYTGE